MVVGKLETGTDTPDSLAVMETVLRIHNHGSQELKWLIMVYNHTSLFLDKFFFQIIGHKLPVQIANSFMKNHHFFKFLEITKNDKSLILIFFKETEPVILYKFKFKKIFT